MEIKVRDKEFKVEEVIYKDNEIKSLPERELDLGSFIRALAVPVEVEYIDRFSITKVFKIVDGDKFIYMDLIIDYDTDVDVIGFNVGLPEMPFGLIDNKVHFEYFAPYLNDFVKELAIEVKIAKHKDFKVIQKMAPDTEIESKPEVMH